MKVATSFGSIRPFVRYSIVLCVLLQSCEFLNPDDPVEDDPTTHVVGYQVLPFQTLTDAGESIQRYYAIWYPSSGPEATFTYDVPMLMNGKVSQNGPLAASAKKFPLILFSHGYTGCALNAVYLTEELARRGFVVAAPDHRDHGCTIHPNEPAQVTLDGDLNFLSFTESSHRGRGHDIVYLLNSIASNPMFSSSVDFTKVGISGHSLGGYTSQAVAGAIGSWKDMRIAAVLNLAAYLTPYYQSSPPLSHDFETTVQVPIFYMVFQKDQIQFNAQVDAYFDSGKPRYSLVFEGQGNANESHRLFTNDICRKASLLEVDKCVATEPRVKLMVDGAFAHFSSALMGQTSKLDQIIDDIFASSTVIDFDYWN